MVFLRDCLSGVVKGFSRQRNESFKEPNRYQVCGHEKVNYTI